MRKTLECARQSITVKDHIMPHKMKRQTGSTYHSTRIGSVLWQKKRGHGTNTSKYTRPRGSSELLKRGGGHHIADEETAGDAAGSLALYKL